MKPLCPSLKILSGETQRIGRLPLAIAAVLAFLRRIILGPEIPTGAAEEWARCYAEGRLLLADTSASDRLAAAIAEWKALEAQLSQTVPA